MNFAQPCRTLHIDSNVLKKAEASETSDFDAGNKERKLTKAQLPELLRQKVDTVGRPGKPGWKIQNVISVGMLSEGWDAKNVTHIMGLRAFSSQLLCEQVVGRGLRRTSYDVNPKTGLFEPEHVNIFGIPFTFLPHEGGVDAPPAPPSPKTEIKPVAEKEYFVISWPNVVRIDHSFRPRLSLDWQALQPVRLEASETPTSADMAPVMDGEPDLTRIDEIRLRKLAHDFRMQRFVFEVARRVYTQMQPKWSGGELNLLGQLVRLMENFVRWDGLTIAPARFDQDELKRRLILALNMEKLFQHIWNAIRFENSTILDLIFDRDRPILSTGDMRPWFTGKPCGPAQHSHINHCVYDSTWEATEAYTLDRSPQVSAWVKNDHLGFEIFYVDKGVVRKYRPDFLVRLASGNMLVLEVKGQETDRDKIKRRYLDEWVRAVNEHAGFGRWSNDVSYSPSDLCEILARHS